MTARGLRGWESDCLLKSGDASRTAPAKLIASYDQANLHLKGDDTVLLNCTERVFKLLVIAGNPRRSPQPPFLRGAKNSFFPPFQGGLGGFERFENTPPEPFLPK